MATVNPNPAAPAIYGSIWSLWGVAALTVIMRFKARSLRGLSWGSDDWMAVVALFFTFCVCVASSLGARFGVGLHTEEVPQSDVQAWNKSLFYGNIVYVSAAPTIKMSALLMYRRIFATPRFRVAGMVLIVICAVWWAGEIVGSIVNCIPINGFWDRSVKAKCISTLNFDLQFAIINISLDAIILALPVKMVLALQLSRSQKAAFVLLFSMGGFVTIAAIIRLIVFIRNLDTPDEMYSWYEGVIWSCVEPCIGVISVCLPLMRPVILVAIPKRFRDSVQSKTKKLFKGSGVTGTRRSFPVRATLTSPRGRKPRNTHSFADDHSFERLHGNDTGLGLGEGSHNTHVVGAQAVDSHVDAEIARPDAIFKRTDVELYEFPRR